MIVHPGVIVVMALLYTAEYMWRFVRYRPRNYIYLGKALARMILMSVYLWVWTTNPPDFQKQIWIRWSITMLMGIDLFYIGQEHMMRHFKKCK